MADYNIQKESTLHLVLRLKGSAMKLFRKLFGQKKSDKVEALHFVGKIKGCEVPIVIKSGTDKNFVDPRIVKRASLTIKDGLCEAVPLEIQGVSAPVNLFIFPMIEPEVILGMAWIKTFKTVTFDAKERAVELRRRSGEEITLKAAPKKELVNFGRMAREIHTTI